jgi:hypothetical protein
MLKLSVQELSGPRSKSGGYTLAVLLVMMVAVGVFIVNRAHLWAPTQLNREREAELIYRGEHLARGIAAFRQSRGRYPISLSEVESMRPRIIRQVYTDPMSENGQWTYIYNVPTAPSGNNEGLPMVGVRSSSNNDSIKRYRGKSLHSEWEFSALDPLLGGPLPGQGQVPLGSTTKQGDQSSSDSNKN